MKVYIVIAQMNSEIDRVFKYKKHAVEYIKAIGYTKKKPIGYFQPNDKEADFHHNYMTVEKEEVL